MNPFLFLYEEGCYDSRLVAPFSHHNFPTISKHYSNPFYLNVTE